jgi:hypothetical protein
VCYNEDFDEISRLGEPLSQWRAKVPTKLNLLVPQNAGCFFPACVGLGCLRQILLRGVVTSSSDRETVRHFTPLHECEAVHTTRVSGLKDFVIIFRPVQVTADIPTGNRMLLYPAQFLSVCNLRPIIRNHCSEELDFDICALREGGGGSNFTKHRMIVH